MTYQQKSVLKSALTAKPTAAQNDARAQLWETVVRLFPNARPPAGSGLVGAAEQRELFLRLIDEAGAETRADLNSAPAAIDFLATARRQLTGVADAPEGFRRLLGSVDRSLSQANADPAGHSAIRAVNAITGARQSHFPYTSRVEATRPVASRPNTTPTPKTLSLAEFNRLTQAERLSFCRRDGKISG